MGRNPCSAGKDRYGSGAVAKQRLRQVLASDTLECSFEQAQMLQKEILEILSRYIELEDTQEISLNFVQGMEQGVRYVKTIQIKRL